MTTLERLLVSPHVHARAFDGETVIVDLERGQYYGLDELGTVLWERMAAGKTLSEVVNEVAPKYDVDVSVLREDLVALCNEWIRLGLVQPGE